jgi:PAS domain S-box-containing protein
MNLRITTLLILSLIFIVSLLVLFALSYIAVMESYREFEGQEMHDNLLGVERLLNSAVDEVDTIVGDWAPWDETYQFAKDKNPSYIENNLNDATMNNLKIDLFLVINTSGSLVFGKAMKGGQEIPLPDWVAPLAAPGEALIRGDDLIGNSRGILILPEGPAIVVAAPILTSQEEGPPSGTLVMVRSLTPSETNRLGVITGSLFKITAADDPAVAPFIASGRTPKEWVKGGSGNGEEEVIIVRGDGWIRGYYAIPDLTGTRSLIIQSEEDRAIYMQGVATSGDFMLAFAILGLLLLLVTLLLLDRLILSRLQALIEAVRSVGPDHSCIERVQVTGDDELTDLGREINQMLDRLAATQNNLRASEEQFRTFIENFPGLIYVKDHAGRIVLVSHHFETLLQHTRPEILGKTYADLLPTSLAEEMERSDLKALDLAPGTSLEERHRISVGGVTRVFSTLRFPIPRAEGTMVGGMAVDVTVWEREHEALQEATRKLNLLTEVTRNDIQNQVFITRGYLGLLQDHISDEEGMRYLTIMSGVLTVIEQKIEFSKHYRDLGVKPPSWQNLTEVLVMAMSKIDLKGIVVERDIEGISVYADLLLETALRLLVENTVVHAEHATWIKFSSVEDGTTLKVVMEDNGTGIPEEKKVGLFERGWTVSGIYSLFLVREILAITGISIRETGEPGLGARFELHLPEGVWRR